mmetsp:Transcript_1646/g.3310  ORF Transcript_1646/g.3310 Transcript_1646/m.3310 type:complete len:216 (+) Transcript_1646:671-1318(+)
MFSSLTSTCSAPASRSCAVASFTLSLGSSHSTTPCSMLGSAAATASDVGSVKSQRESSSLTTFGANRSFMSVSPSRGFVLTQHCAPDDEARRSRSAGKASSCSTSTTSPTRTSAQVPSIHCPGSVEIGPLSTVTMPASNSPTWSLASTTLGLSPAAASSPSRAPRWPRRQSQSVPPSPSPSPSPPSPPSSAEAAYISYAGSSAAEVSTPASPSMS